MFKYKDESIIIDVPVLEAYIPYEYGETGLMETIGQEVRVFGVFNFRDFKSESSIKDRNSKDAYPCCIAAFFNTIPTEKDIEEISLYKGDIPKKMIVLRYFKNDIFVVNRNIIKSVDNVTALLGLLDAGKLENIEYELVPDVIEKAQAINGMSLKVPPESIYAMVAERYRNPNDSNMKARHMKTKPKHVISVTPREGAATTSTFSGITFEDINSSLIAAHNRKISGVQEDETIIEKIIKGEKMK